MQLVTPTKAASGGRFPPSLAALAILFVGSAGSGYWWYQNHMKQLVEAPLAVDATAAAPAPENGPEVPASETVPVVDRAADAAPQSSLLDSAVKALDDPSLLEKPATKEPEVCDDVQLTGNPSGAKQETNDGKGASDKSVENGATPQKASGEKPVANKSGNDSTESVKNSTNNGGAKSEPEKSQVKTSPAGKVAESKPPVTTATRPAAANPAPTNPIGKSSAAPRIETAAKPTPHSIQSRVDRVAPATATTQSTAGNASESPRQIMAPRGDWTLVYWNRMNAIIAEENAARTKVTQIDQNTVNGYLTARTTNYAKASLQLKQVGVLGVDPNVRALAMQIAQWYDAGAALSQRAQQVLKLSDAERKGATGQQWRSSEERHRSDVQEINRRGEEVRQEMITKYGLQFPPLN